MSVFVSDFDLRSFLCSESEQLIWKSQGLPSDDLSMENALVILQVRHPFACLSHLGEISTFCFNSLDCNSALTQKDLSYESS